MKKSASKRRVGRPAGRKAPVRPVLSVRVPQELYDRIKIVASLSGRTVSEETVWQAQIALKIGDAQKTLSDIAHATQATLPAKMRQFGLKPVHAPFGTYWLEEGMPPLQHRLDSELTAAIVEAVKEAIKDNKS